VRERLLGPVRIKKKISITLPDDVLEEVDSFVDGTQVKSRSEAIAFLAKTAVKKTAVLDCTNEKATLSVFNTKSLYYWAVAKLESYGFQKCVVLGSPSFFQKVKKDESSMTLIPYTVDKPLRMTEKLQLIKDHLHSSFLYVPGHILFNIDLRDLFNFHKASAKTITFAVSKETTTLPTGIVKMKGNRIIDYISADQADFKITGDGLFMPQKGYSLTELFVAEPELLDYPQLFSNELFNAVVQKNEATTFPIFGWTSSFASLLGRQFAIHNLQVSVCFDWSGTLSLDLGIKAEAFAQSMKNYFKLANPISQLKKEYLKTAGLHRFEQAEHVLQKKMSIDILSKWSEVFSKTFFTMNQKTLIKPSVISLLKKIKNDSPVTINLFIGSIIPEKMLKKMAEDAKITHLFKQVIGKHGFDRKPYYNTIQRSFWGPYETFVFIFDTYKDLQALIKAVHNKRESRIIAIKVGQTPEIVQDPKMTLPKHVEFYTLKKVEEVFSLLSSLLKP